MNSFGFFLSSLFSYLRVGLDFLAATANIVQHLLDAFLIDDPHTLAGYTKRHKTLLRLYPETVLV